MHRDIKPANIMVDFSGLAKITDFGIAKLINSSTDITRGLAVGTLEHMSPEQLNAEPLDGVGVGSGLVFRQLSDWPTNGPARPRERPVSSAARRFVEQLFPERARVEPWLVRSGPL